MALDLLFSRQRVTDESVRFTDVQVGSASIMVDALSFLSRYKRSAGWLYPIRQASPSDYERGVGRLILFGKTRVVFDDFPPPYYLEFFPRYGVGNYILSVYTGIFDVEGVPGWVNLMGGGWWVNYYPDEQVVRTRLGGEGSPVYDFATSAVDAIVVSDALLFRRSDDTCEKWTPYSSGSGPVSLGEYLVLRVAQGTVILS